MPAVWFALKRSLNCKPEPYDVHDPRASSNLNSILTRKTGRSGCSRSLSNLRDVIHGSKRHLEPPASWSPRSIGSSDFFNPITHEVVLSNSTCELKVTGFGATHEGNCGVVSASSFVGTLRPGTPGPGSHQIVAPNYDPRKTPSGLCGRERSTRFKVSGVHAGRGIDSNRRASLGTDSNGSLAVICSKCGDQFKTLEAIEAHHLSKHAVTVLVEGDSSRKIVEMICHTSWLKSENNCERFKRVLKVHNMQKTLVQFEEYREMVKVKASKLPKKHPRCLADGNELLRFYGTTVACTLGKNGSSSLCTLGKCNVCRILRDGFSSKKESNGGVGVFTTSTSGRAFESIEIYDENQTVKRALIICRVVAGRVHRTMENFQELAGQSGFDSVAGKLGLYSNIEELYLLSPKALLPCFIVIFKSC